MASATGTAIQSAASSAISYGLNVALPGLGTAFGIASSIFGGMFGGGTQRQSINAIIAPPDAGGKIGIVNVGQKNSTTATARSFGDAVIAGLDSIESQTGFKVTKGYNVSANIGSKDAGTFLNDKRISTTGGDVNAAIKSILDDSSFDYKLLESPPAGAAKENTSSGGSAFATSQAGIDPAGAIAMQSGNSTQYMLIGLIILTILISTRKG